MSSPSLSKYPTHNIHNQARRHGNQEQICTSHDPVMPQPRR